MPEEQQPRPAGTSSGAPRPPTAPAPRTNEVRTPGDSATETEAEPQEQSETQAATAVDEGPVGEGDYIVKEGDCISSIARDHGHFWQTIWDEPANAELKEKRKNPNVLREGDRVTIPTIEPKEESGETEMRHRFVRRGEPASCRITLLDDGEPRANVPYRLDIDGEEQEGTTDGNGMLVVSIPGNAKKGKLFVGEEDEEEEIQLLLGHVAPIDQIKGIKDRLRNLGFRVGHDNDKLDAKTRIALEQFQEENELTVTGEPDENTKEKLLEEHGC